jgi:hypothetical protein
MRSVCRPLSGLTGECRFFAYSPCLNRHYQGEKKMRLNWLAMAAAMALPFVRRRVPDGTEMPYRSSRETVARSLRREDQSLMGRHWY